MKRIGLRTLGFFVPTAAVVMTLHLVREASTGEAIDGIVSSLWFTLPFAAGAGIDEALRARGHRAPLSPAANLLSGFAAGLLAWGALWALWALPIIQPLRALPALSFALNCAVALLAGFVHLPAPKARSTHAA
jgi:hypothetical protein